MILFNLPTNQSMTLNIMQEMLIWIGTHETKFKPQTERKPFIIFSPVTAPKYSQIKVDEKKNVFWRESVYSSEWFHARIYNMAVNPNRYISLVSTKDMAVIWRLAPFEQCISLGIISVESIMQNSETTLAQRVVIPPKESNKLLASADLLTTPYTAKELQWLKYPEFA